MSPIILTSHLVFGLRDQHQVYTLQAVIYLSGNHFTARFINQQAMWWNYDNMWEFGAPHIDHINNKADLLKNGGWHVEFLLYCQTESQG